MPSSSVKTPKASPAFWKPTVARSFQAVMLSGVCTPGIASPALVIVQKRASGE